MGHTLSCSKHGWKQTVFDDDHEGECVYCERDALRAALTASAAREAVLRESARVLLALYLASEEMPRPAGSEPTYWSIYRVPLARVEAVATSRAVYDLMHAPGGEAVLP